MDGDKSVSYILNQCASRDITTIAVTDHNSTEAVEEAIEIAPAYGIDIIPGIEIDTVFGGTVFHLLGYFVDHKSPDFRQLCRNAEKAELAAFPGMIEKLRELGFRISWESVLEKAGELRPTEEMIARLTVTNPENADHKLMLPFQGGGERSGMPVFNFYYDYMAPGKHAFILREYIPLKEAVSLVKKNGGIPILAHPGSNLKGHEDLVSGILESGIRGFEAFSSYHDAEACRSFARLSQENDMLITCGSDFHGSLKPEIILGEHGCTLSQDEILKKLKAELI